MVLNDDYVGNMPNYANNNDNPMVIEFLHKDWSNDYDKKFDYQRLNIVEDFDSIYLSLLMMEIHSLL
jgi:hypothetical protein